MGGDKRFGGIRRGKSHGLIFAFACLALLAGGCSKSEPEKADNGATFDSSRLPRISGAKEIFASPATTIFTSPDSVVQTADTLDKALAAAGWQKYVAPNTVYSQDPKMRAMSLKRGTQALSVFITVAPAQNNATSVQYAALPLKADLPFTKDASAIEYSPDRPLLTSGHRGAGRQDAGFLPQGAWRARLGALVRKDQWKAAGRWAFGSRAQAWRLCPLRQRQSAGGDACAHGAIC